MEPIIAVLVLIGALIFGDNALDKEAARSGGESSATSTLADSQACDIRGPRQRDLTVPYISRTTPASMSAEACDE